MSKSRGSAESDEVDRGNERCGVHKCLLDMWKWERRAAIGWSQREWALGITNSAAVEALHSLDALRGWLLWVAYVARL